MSFQKEIIASNNIRGIKMFFAQLNMLGVIFKATSFLSWYCLFPLFPLFRVMR